MSQPTYRTYWTAWLVLLLLTLGMVFLGAGPLIVAGVLAKAAIILLLYMHLGSEHRRLVTTVLIGIFVTSAFLVFLMVPDGKAM